MIIFVMIGGEPGTGKSTLMRKVIERLEIKERSAGAAPLRLEYKLLRGTIYRETRVTVLGEYAPGEKFPGTDKLSMAVQPDAELWAIAMDRNAKYEGWVVFAEGDRVCNRSFLTKLRQEGMRYVELVILEASQSVLQRRYATRGSNQSEQFLKGRATKYMHLRDARWNAFVLRNETPSDLEENLNSMMGYVECRRSKDVTPA